MRPVMQQAFAVVGNVAITVLAFLFAPRNRPKSWREW